MAPSAQATCSRTPASVSLSASTSAGTASERRARQAPTPRSCARSRQVRRSTFGGAARRPGFRWRPGPRPPARPATVVFVHPPRHVRSPQTAGSTGDPSSSIAVRRAEHRRRAAAELAQLAGGTRSDGGIGEASPAAAAFASRCAGSASSSAATAHAFITAPPSVRGPRCGRTASWTGRSAGLDSDSDSDGGSGGFGRGCGWWMRVVIPADLGDRHRGAAADGGVFVLERLGQRVERFASPISPSAAVTRLRTSGLLSLSAAISAIDRRQASPISPSADSDGRRASRGRRPSARRRARGRRGGCSIARARGRPSAARPRRCP